MSKLSIKTEITSGLEPESTIQENEQQEQSDTEIKRSRKKIRHPTTSKMVISALKTLEQRRKGISLYAIKKYIASKFSINIQKYKPYLTKYLKRAVDDGELIRIKQSYKLSRKSLRKQKPPKKQSIKKEAKIIPKSKITAKKQQQQINDLIKFYSAFLSQIKKQL